VWGGGGDVLRASIGTAPNENEEASSPFCVAVWWGFVSMNGLKKVLFWGWAVTFLF
jgi:hypothetical protein